MHIWCAQTLVHPVASEGDAASAGDELDMLFETAEQGDVGAEGRDGFQGPKSVLSSFARFMTSLSK